MTYSYQALTKERVSRLRKIKRILNFLITVTVATTGICLLRAFIDPPMNPATVLMGGIFATLILFVIHSTVTEEIDSKEKTI